MTVRFHVLSRTIVVSGLTTLVLAAALAAPTRQAAASEGVALGYEGYFGGFHMMTADVQLVRNEERYRMETTAVGKGLVGWMFDWRSHALTEGAIADDGSYRPELHKRDIAQRGRRPKAILIEYRNDGIPFVARMRVGDEARFTERAEKRDTLDPMSAVAAIIDQMTVGARCAGTFKVFDGKLHYSVTAREGQADVLSGNRYMMFEGEAARCDLTLTAIDGFEEKFRGNPREREVVSDESLQLTMWFAAPQDGMPAVPVLASADTSYGGLRVYLSRAETADVPAEGARAEAGRPASRAR